MTTPDNTEHPNEEVQELTDENLEEVSGGARIRLVGIGEFERANLTSGDSTGGQGGDGWIGGNGGCAGLFH
jgi:hypothetical protein